jgi:hypothetical protein
VLAGQAHQRREPHDTSEHLRFIRLSTFGELHPCNVTPCAAILHRRCALHHLVPAHQSRVGGLAAMTESLSDGLGAFAMLPLEPDGPLLVALREGRLLSRDFGVLWLVVARLDWRTGRAWVTTAELAAAMGNNCPGRVQESLARLRREALVARGSDRRDPRRRYWCISPVVAATGGKHRRALQWEQFQRALE